MADCGCDKALQSMEDVLHNQADPATAGDVAEHLACCPPCEDEWKVGQTLVNSVKRACCEEAPAELKVTIVNTLRDSGQTPRA